MTIRKSTCPICSKVATSTAEKIGKSKCNNCGGYLHKQRKIEIFVACLHDDCHFENKVTAFGWVQRPCQSCGKPIIHPSAKPVGAHLKGTGIKNDTRITIKIPKAEKRLIEALAKKHESTTSAILRQMIRYFDDRLC